MAEDMMSKAGEALEPQVAVKTVGGVTIRVDELRSVTIEPDSLQAKDGSQVEWELVVDGVLMPSVHVMPFETVLLVPDPDSGWEAGLGMPFDDGAPPRVTCHKKVGMLPTTTTYLVTVEFPDDGKSRTVIGSIIIVD